MQQPKVHHQQRAGVYNIQCSRQSGRHIEVPLLRQRAANGQSGTVLDLEKHKNRTLWNIKKRQ